MELIQEILETQDKLNSLWLNELHLFLFLVSIVFTLIGLYCKVGEEPYDIDKITRGIVWSVVCINIIGMIIIFSIRGSVEDKLIVLEKEYFDSIDDELIEIKEGLVVHSQNVVSNYCPHIDFIESKQECLFIKIFHNEKVNQLFVPSDSVYVKEGKKLIDTSYYSLTKDNREFLNKYLNINMGYVKKQLDIDENNWSLGYSIK